MCCGVRCTCGHMSDPIDRPGLAHFCEHMLFLGNDKYPGEDEFEQYISRVGGTSNAFTDTEDTCYFFELPDPAKVGSALERWGPFFSSPKFAQDATRREVEAIDSEHSKNLKSDGFRLFQLTKSRFPDTHPFSKFGTGTKKTLQGDGDPPVNELRAFYGMNYVGSNMACVVCSTQSLDVLQKLTENALHRMSNGQIEVVPSSLYFTKTRPQKIRMPMSWHRSSRSESSVCSGSYHMIEHHQRMPLRIGYKNATSG